MDLIGQHVFFFAPAWVMAILCYAITTKDIYLSCHRTRKRWPKRLKAVNWFFVGSVYLYISTGNYNNADVRVLIRISIAFLILGEAAYHTDTFQDMFDSALILVKRLIKYE